MMANIFTAPSPIFQQFLEASNQGFGIATLDGLIHYVNPALLKMIAEEDLAAVQGQPLAKYYPAEYQDLIRDTVLPLVMKTGHWTGTTELLSTVGDRIAVSESYFLILGPDGQPQFIADVITDISEQINNERVLTMALKEVDYNQQLLYALSQASQQVQRASSSTDVYRILGDELRKLDFDSQVFLVSDDRQSLEIVHTTYAAEAIQAAEKLVGLAVIGHQFPLSGTWFEEFIKQGEIIFDDEPLAAMEEAFPKMLRPLVGQVAKLLGIERAIMAPLIIDVEVMGLLLVTGSKLSPDDIPPMTVFANQASIALENTRLYEANVERAKKLEVTVAERTAQLEARTRDLTLINRITEASLQGETLTAISALLAVEAAEIFHSVSASIYSLENNGQTLRLLNPNLKPEVTQQIEKLIRRPIPTVEISLVSDSHYSRILRDKVPYMTSDQAEIQEIINEFAQAASLPFGIRKLIQRMIPRIQKIINIFSLIIVPLYYENRPIGIIELSRTTPFTAAELGRFAAVASQLTAIINRKRADQALRISEEKYRALVESASDGIIIAQEKMIRFVNQQFADLLGYEISDLIGLDFMKLVPPERVAEMSDKYEKRMAGKAVPSIYDSELILKDGQRLPVEINANLFQYQGENAVLVFIRDIRERREITSHIRYQAEILKGVSDAIISADPNFVIQSWNKSAETMYGWQADEVIGKSFVDIIQPDYVNLTRDTVVAEFLETGSFSGEAIHQCKDGLTLSVHTAVNAIRDEAGSISAVVAVNRDISDRKRAEQELATRMAELERFNRLAMGREQRVIELKQKVNTLLTELGRDPAYPMTYLEEQTDGS